MELFDPRLMRLLTFLTRRQAWMSHREVAKALRIDGEPVTSRTVHRWFVFLRETASFVYYPYPRANLLGLQDVVVTVRGLRQPEVLSVLPFGASFGIEVGMADGIPFASQGYWVPGTAMEAFQEYWRAARDLGLLDEVDVFQSRNTHFVYSPFESLIGPDGNTGLHGPVDNSHFESLLRAQLRRPFEVEVGDPIARAPLVVPIVLEHLWAHYSSRQVWQAIRGKWDAPIRAYGPALARNVDRPGAALRIVQEQWAAILRHFNEVFVQPRVFFDWTRLRNTMFLSFVLQPGSVEGMIDAAIRASERALYTSFKPGAGDEARCMITCLAPSDQLVPLLQVVRDHHRGREAPVVSVQDKTATAELFQKTFCRVDWRLFDPSALGWRFHRHQYAETLKRLRPEAPLTPSPRGRARSRGSQSPGRNRRPRGGPGAP